MSHDLVYSEMTLFTSTATTTTVIWPMVWDHPNELVPEETFTHSHSLTILNQLPPSTTIDSIHPVQFICLTVFLHNFSPSHFGLSLGLEASTSHSIHFFTQSSSLRNTCPYHYNLFCCSTELMLSNLVSLATHYLELDLLP